MEQNQKPNRKNGSSYSTIFAKQVIGELIRENLTSVEAGKRHGVSKTTVREWKKKYAAQLAAFIPPVPMTTEEKASLAAQQTRIQQLEAALQTAQLQISALELTIDLAERDLDVDIRKKYGSRQSKC